MLRIGNAKPLSMNAGSAKKNDAIMACCCVREIVERNSPAPRVVIRNSTAEKNSSSTLPRNGMWKSTRAAAVISDGLVVASRAPSVGLLLAAGGSLRSSYALVCVGPLLWAYWRNRRDLLVIAAVALQYSAIAFYVLPH